jgi:hypothetical protein
MVREVRRMALGPSTIRVSSLVAQRQTSGAIPFSHCALRELRELKQQVLGIWHEAPMTIPVSDQSTYPLEYHFRGARSAMRPLFNAVLSRLERELDFELKIGKAYIGLLHRLVFAALHVQTKKIVVEFTSRKKIANRRIVKSKQFQKSRWAYYVDVATPASFDAQLLKWIKDSYE